MRIISPQKSGEARHRAPANTQKSNSFYPINQILYRLFINNFILLTFMGRQAVEFKLIKIRQILSVNYFIYFIVTNYIYIIRDKIIISNK